MRRTALSPLLSVVLAAGCGGASLVPAGDAGVVEDAEDAAAPGKDAGLSLEDAAVDPPPPPPFEGSELIDGRLALRTQLTAACTRDGCEDLDADGLADDWEVLVLEAFRPRLRLAEGEPFLSDPDARLLQIARVFPVSFEPLRVRALIAIGWHRDYGSTCGGISAHAGDPERVAVELEAIDGGGPGDVTLARAYTAAHEHTAADASHLFGADELDQIEYDGEPRWVIYAALRKHGSFASIERCEGASRVPCLRETCGDAAELLPEAINAGEPDRPLIDDLEGYGFPGDLVWTDTDFCGGQTRGLCSGPLSNKLIDDPFAAQP